jgi:hypothetical protein
MGALTIHSGKLSAQKSALRKRFAKKIEEIRNRLESTMKPIVAEAAQELGARTFPSVNAIGLAVQAMRFDVSRVYITAGKAFEIIEQSAGKPAAGAFYAAYKRGDYNSCRAILRNSGSPIANIRIGEPLDPNIREKSRDAKGRVMSAHPLQIVEAAELNAHIKTAIEEIGKTSSGWYAAAAELGGDGNEIAWKGIAKHGSDGGSARTERTDTGVRITIRNHRPLARKHISPGQVAPIVKRAREKIRRAMMDGSRA